MAHQLFETAGEAAKAPCSHYANFSTSFGVAITKVHLIKRQTVEDYAAQHARSRSSFTLSNGREIRDWDTPAGIQQTFGSADLPGNGSNRVVFDIGGI